MKKAFAVLTLILLGLSSPQIFAETKPAKKKAVHEDTVAQRFEKTMAEIKAECDMRKAPSSVCSLLYLQPYNPLATNEGKYAQSINFPELQSVGELYRPGMSSEEYFNTLCQYEAGEFITKPVENVLGVFQIRPREVVDLNVMQHLYAMEDPYGYQLWEATRPQDYFVQPPAGRYQFFEVQGKQYRKEREVKDAKDTKNAKFITAVVDGKSVRVPYLVSEKPIEGKYESQYGYIWRAIRRHKDRELGIAGSELIIIDLNQNKLVAFRRGFVRGVVPGTLTGIAWDQGARCPQAPSYETYTLDFIYRVLRPAPQQ
jgi:hypothetical protein